MVSASEQQPSFITDTNICYLCQGDQQIEDLPNKFVPCPACKGLGKFVTFNIRYISPELRQRFKVWCAERGISMSEAAVRLMERAVDEDLELEGESE